MKFLILMIFSSTLSAKVCWQPVAGGLPVLDFEGKPTLTLGGKVSSIKPCTKPRGLRVEDSPEKANCLNGALTVCDSKYAGMRLFINPKPNEQKPCQMWKIVPKSLPTGDMVYDILTYSGWKVRPDGTYYCIGD